jgi:lysosomal acid lipase/cholesteryl ester hydrolase
MFNRIAEVMPASTSMKHVSHIAQCFNDGKFRAFNYSRSGNIKHYGQAKPPLYDLSKVTVPVVTFTAAHDRLVPAIDVERTANSLPNLISHHNVSSPKFSHCDFLFGVDAEKLVYAPIVQILNKFLRSSASKNNNCIIVNEEKVDSEK